MKRKKMGFTLVELMAVIAVATIVLPIIASTFIQGYKIIKRTENKAIVQNDFRTILMNIEKNIEGIGINGIKGYKVNDSDTVENKAVINYDGESYEGRYIVDLISPSNKAFFEVEVDDKKEIWESEYNSRTSSGDITYYTVFLNKVLVHNMDKTISIEAEDSNGILVFKMNETDISSAYAGGVKTDENNDINIGVTSGEESTGGEYQPILLANNVDGKVKLISNNKEVFFDNEKIGEYYVINSKGYEHSISNSAYGIHKNKGEGIKLPNYKFEMVSEIVLNTIDEQLYYDKPESTEKVKVTGLGQSDEVKEIQGMNGVRYFTVNDYKVYMFNTSKLIINNSTTNNLKWNKLNLTDTIIICSGEIEINNKEYCTTNLSGSMIAGKHISVDNTDGSMIMFGESERRLRISKGTIRKIEEKVKTWSY